MALYYDKLTDITTVLSPREMAYRKFNMGDDWTEIRIGGWISAVAATGPNDINVSEIYAVSNVTDYPFFGIHNSKTVYPGEVGSRSLGINTNAATVVSGAGSGIGSAGGAWVAVSYVDATRTVVGSTGGSGTGGIGSADPSLATGYASFAAVKFVVNNRGLATQSVTISTVVDNYGTAGSDYSAESLRVRINTSSYVSVGTLAWNDGVLAYDLPDLIALRSPLFNNSLRMSAWRVVRYAP